MTADEAARLRALVKQLREDARGYRADASGDGTLRGEMVKRGHAAGLEDAAVAVEGFLLATALLSSPAPPAGDKQPTDNAGSWIEHDHSKGQPLTSACERPCEVDYDRATSAPIGDER